MTKTLGLDLGTNSIGWALIDNSTNELIECGTRVFPNKQSKAKLVRQTKSKTELVYESVKQSASTSPFLFSLTVVTALTFMLTILNKTNWQFWLNIALTALFSTLTLFHQNKDKK